MDSQAQNALHLLQDLCRLCLDAPGTHKICTDPNINQAMFQCTGIMQVSASDKLPQSICETCYVRVRIAKDLRLFASRNDFYMRSMLSNDILPLNMIRRPSISFTPIRRTETFTKDENRNTKCSNLSLTTEVRSMRNTDVTEVHENNSVKIEYVDQNDTNTTNTSNPIISVQSSANITSNKPATVAISSSTTAPATTRQTRSATRNESAMIDTSKSSSESTTKSPTVEKKKEYKCDDCQKVYASPKKLYLHKRSHTKKIQCPLDACDKKFACKGDLQKHLRSHTGEKPYRCNLCDKSFTQNVSLKNHKEVTHQVTMGAQ